MTFDRLAPHYRWIEHAVFGRTLHRCRVALLPQVADCRQALILGEGDGRFLSAFLAACPFAVVDVVDVSPRMIELAHRRVKASDAGRVRFTVADARVAPLPSSAYDLIVTNFFLDCFPFNELTPLMKKLAESLASGGRWIVGDFRLPTAAGPRGRGAFKLAVMYAGFRLATVLPASALIDPDPLLLAQGMKLNAERTWQNGFLSARLWRKPTSSPG